MQKILIVGAGDVARRILPQLVGRYRVFALVRNRDHAATWRAAGAVPLLADLDDRPSLDRLAGVADLILHLAPPPNGGETDSRTRWLLAALRKGKSLPWRLIYVSTTGVYGDCRGACIDETRSPAPATARGRRRLDAEKRLRAAGCGGRIAVSLLRAPGIYAADRLPVDRLRAGLPALEAGDDVYTNHIHADDLARACVAALRRGRPNRAYNVVDDSAMKMGDYFDLVADARGLPRPPRLPRQQLAAALSPLQWSFMGESRRIGNRRLKTELKLPLRYPTVAAGLQDAQERTA